MMNDYVDSMKAALKFFKSIYGEDKVKVIPYREKSFITSLKSDYSITVNDAIKQSYKIKSKDKITICCRDLLQQKEILYTFESNGEIISHTCKYFFNTKGLLLDKIISLLEERVALLIYEIYHDYYRCLDFKNSSEDDIKRAQNLIP